jgi:hypothetical protein
MPLRQPARTPFPTCKLCSEPLDIKTAKTDGDGQAVHEECYLASLKKRPSDERDFA